MTFVVLQVYTLFLFFLLRIYIRCVGGVAAVCWLSALQRAFCAFKYISTVFCSDMGLALIIATMEPRKTGVSYYFCTRQWFILYLSLETLAKSYTRPKIIQLKISSHQKQVFIQSYATYAGGHITAHPYHSPPACHPRTGAGCCSAKQGHPPSREPNHPSG